jgi:hypothetical protein
VQLVGPVNRRSRGIVYQRQSEGTNCRALPAHLDIGMPRDVIAYDGSVYLDGLIGKGVLADQPRLVWATSCSSAAKAESSTDGGARNKTRDNIAGLMLHPDPS